MFKCYLHTTQSTSYSKKFDIDFSQQITTNSDSNKSSIKFNLGNTTRSTQKLKQSPYTYDAIVLGGGSGGLAFASRSASFGSKLLVLDYVLPSHQGTSWGLGGTCVNSGCIPKKLFHQSGLIGESLGIHFAKNSLSSDMSTHSTMNAFGWDVDVKGFRWNQLQQNVESHIKSLNFKYRSKLISEKVEYKNAFGRIKDEHTIEIVEPTWMNDQWEFKVKEEVTTDNIIIATGGRPKLLPIPGIEHCITSDDLFHLKSDPGETLIVGAGYIALECAGFLSSLPQPKDLKLVHELQQKKNTTYTEMRNASLGTEKRRVSLMVRSRPLRHFDSSSVDHIVEHMTNQCGINFLYSSFPTKIERLDNGSLQVTFKEGETTRQKTFDTVLFAIGRESNVSQIFSSESKIKLDIDSNTKKLITDENMKTNVPSIYAIGDVTDELELTPVAIHAGKTCAINLFSPKQKKKRYYNVPTTIFTPLEYSSIGQSEEQALKQYSKDDVIIYHKKVNVLENQLTDEPNQVFIKIITLKSENERVIGFHFVGPNAGEVAQSVSTAMTLGVTKDDLDDTIGIHPTSAESMTMLQLGVTEDTGC